MCTDRLDACGWSSFDPTLFLNEPGRVGRIDVVGPPLLSIVRDFSRGPSVLELCSGGGALLIYLARNGFDVTGLDLSKEMLALCRTAIAREPKDVRDRITLVHGDVAGFALRDVYDFVVFEDDGFQYLLSSEDQLACLESVRAHLKPEARFLLSFSHAPRKKDSDRYDPVSQIRTSRERWVKPDEHGHIEEIWQGFEKARLTYPGELELLLEMAHLKVEARWGDLLRRPFRDPAEGGYHYLIRRDDAR